MPSREALVAYNAHYFDEAHAGVAEAEAARPFHRAINQLRFQHVARYLEAEKAGLRVLEVGPGLGDFAQHMLRAMPASQHSWLSQTTGAGPPSPSLATGTGLRSIRSLSTTALT